MTNHAAPPTTVGCTDASGGGVPDAWAVVQASGFIVGCWRDRATAEHVASLKPARDDEQVVPVRFMTPNADVVRLDAAGGQSERTER